MVICILFSSVPFPAMTAYWLRDPVQVNSLLWGCLSLSVKWSSLQPHHAPPLTHTHTQLCGRFKKLMQIKVSSAGLQAVIYDVICSVNYNLETLSWLDM